MKIFIIPKKKIGISCFVMLLIIIISCFFFDFKNKETLAVELSSNSMISEEFENKIKNLTKEEEKVAYLTFDDGPTISTTPKVLDILKEEDIKATFFVIGKYVEKHPEIVKQAYDDGHYIANHGYNHKNSMLYKTEESFIDEIKKTDKAIGKAIGIENYCSHVFRFPNGFMSPQNKGKKKRAAQLLSSMNYTYIDWNCLNNDSVKKYSNAQLLNNLKKSAKNKNTLVVLMHDTKDVNDSSKVLKDSIEYLKSQGYSFRNFYDISI